MSANLAFRFVIALALVLGIALTVREAVATSAITAGRDPVPCSSLPSGHSIRTEHVEKSGLLIVRTEHGPAGVDGGLVELFSAYRTCSR